MGVDAEETRNALERRAEVPFDSEYKFMATFHDRPDWLAGGVLKEPHFMTVKGAPDVVIERCSHALWHGQEVPIAEVRTSSSPPTSSCPRRDCACSRSPYAISTTRRCRRRSPIRWRRCTICVLVALVGIIDPLRAEAKDAVRIALTPASTSG